MLQIRFFRDPTHKAFGHAHSYLRTLETFSVESGKGCQGESGELPP